jgi:hypothetical protein
LGEQHFSPAIGFFAIIFTVDPVSSDNLKNLFQKSSGFLQAAAFDDCSFSRLKNPPLKPAQAGVWLYETAFFKGRCFKT